MEYTQSFARTTPLFHQDEEYILHLLFLQKGSIVRSPSGTSLAPKVNPSSSNNSVSESKPRFELYLRRFFTCK